METKNQNNEKDGANSLVYKLAFGIKICFGAVQPAVNVNWLHYLQLPLALHLDWAIILLPTLG